MVGNHAASLIYANRARKMGIEKPLIRWSLIPKEHHDIFAGKTLTIKKRQNIRKKYPQANKEQLKQTMIKLQKYNLTQLTIPRIAKNGEISVEYE